MQELIGEHQQARDQVAKIAALNARFREGDRSSVGAIAEIIRWFCAFYPVHIKKEDSEFFPNTEKFFSPQELDANLEEYGAFDARMIHEKYLALYESLNCKSPCTKECVMTDLQPDDWNPLDPSVLKDQSLAYDAMREKCPVAHSEFLGWSLFRHEDIVQVLADPQTYSNVSPFPAIPNGMDPPLHGQYRKALDPNFDTEQLARIEPLVRGIAASLLDALPKLGEVEFIQAFVTPFSLKTLCAWLGWPETQWDLLNGWIHGNQKAAFEKDAVAGKAQASFFSKHVKANLEAHRASPNRVADATDALLATKVDARGLDDDQIVNVLRNWAAGHGTVAGSLGLLVRRLAQDSALQDRLRNNQPLIPAAIEEILRADGPLVANPRTTTREVTLRGRTIPKGEHLTLMWMAANHDSTVFEDPKTVRLDRNTSAGLVWGQGAHVCQGAGLARLEMRVALEELLARTTGFTLAGDGPRREVYPSNGLATLPLRVR